MSKIKRNSRKNYENCVGKNISAKTLAKVNECCKNACGCKISTGIQKQCLKKFYQEYKSLQNAFIASCMSRCNKKKQCY